MGDQLRISVHDLLMTFRRTLAAMVPVLAEVGVAWRDGQKYDDLESIEEAVFDSIVEGSIRHGGLVEGTPDRILPRYDLVGVDRSAFPAALVVKAIGGDTALQFVAFSSTVQPYDGIRVVSPDGSEVRIPIDGAQFELVLQDGSVIQELTVDV